MIKADKIQFVLMKEHPIMGYALSFMAGAYLALSVKIPLLYILIFLAVFIICKFIFICRQRRPWIFMLFVFAASGYLLCLNSIPQWYFQSSVPPGECRISGTVESVKSTGYSYEYVLYDVLIDGEETNSKIKISNITDRDYIEEGYRIILKAVPEKPAVAQQSGMFAQDRYYMTKNIQYTATIFDSWISIADKNAGEASLSTALQSSIFERYSKDFSQPVSGLLYSLTTGDKSYIDKDIYAACADLGIAHIFAISGLHIGALLLLWEVYCNKTKKRFLVKIMGSAVLVAALYAVVGARASLLRAIAMWALYIIYQYAGIKGNLIDFLAIAMTGLLIFNPLYIIDLGFLLSVSCVGAIGLVYAPIAGMKRGDKFRKIINFYPVSMFLVSVSILCVSWVITAKAFGQVAILSPLWNVVLVPMIVVLISLLLGYGLLFYVPLLGTAISFLIDKFVNLIIYLVKVFSSVNIEIKTAKMGIIMALSIMGILLLMTDLIIKGRKRLRIAAGISAAVLILAGAAAMPEPDRLEVYAGYDAAFIYIADGGENALIINEDDGGIRRVLEDIDADRINTLIYSGNDIEDLECLIEGADEITFDKIIVNKEILSGYAGAGEYYGADDFEIISAGGTEIYMAAFRANEKAVTHYYVRINYYDRDFLYLDPMRLREGAVEGCEIAISSRWTKQRIENIVFASPQYAIINSRDYLMGEGVVTENGYNVPIFNINNSGAFTYYPQKGK